MKKLFKNVFRALMWITIAFIGVSVLGVIYLFLNIYFNSGDDNLIDDDHLSFEVLNISDEDNAYFDLKKAVESSYYPENKESLIDEMHKGVNWDQEFANELINKNTQTLEYFSNSLEKMVLIDPGVNQLSVDDITYLIEVDYLVDFRKISNIYFISIRSDINQGKNKLAFEKINLYLDFIYKNKQSNFTIIEYLIMLSMVDYIYLIIEENVDFFHKENNFVLQSKLEKQKENEKGLAQVFTFEYLVMKNIILDMNHEDVRYLLNLEGMPTPKFGSSYYFKPNQTVNITTNKVKMNIENSFKECYEFSPVEDAKISRSILKWLFTENASGKMMLQLMDLDMNSVQEKRCAEDLKISFLQVKLAAEAYKKDNGHYPDSIQVMNDDGYLTVEIPQTINGEDVVYDSSIGEIKNN